MGDPWDKGRQLSARLQLLAELRLDGLDKVQCLQPVEGNVVLDGDGQLVGLGICHTVGGSSSRGQVGTRVMAQSLEER